MPRPKSGCALTAAERKRASRIVQAGHGKVRRPFELTAENAAKAERVAAARGLSSATAAVNALVAEAPE